MPFCRDSFSEAALQIPLNIVALNEAEDPLLSCNWSAQPLSIHSSAVRRQPNEVESPCIPPARHKTGQPAKRSAVSLHYPVEACSPPWMALRQGDTYAEGTAHRSRKS